MKTIPFALAVLVALLGALPGFARVEADPNKHYPITPEAGPWLIFTTYYTGPDAAQQAHELSVEIRRRHNLPAYVFNKGEEEKRQQREQMEKVRKLAPEARLRLTRIEEQYAVLVGGYKDMDSARKALDGIKKLPPPPKKLMRILEFTSRDPAAGAEKKDLMYDSPFDHSFVVRNPTVPHEPPPDKNKLDPFLKELNAGESYSLLNCKKSWTLVVKEFQGAAVIQPKSASSAFLEKLGMGSKNGDLLNAGAMQAHEIAKVFRENLKIETYVLHTRTSSLVCVGGFDGPEDPEMQRYQRMLANGKLGEFQFFAQPVPMKIPRP